MIIMDIEKLKEEFGQKILSWEASQENQTDGYEYERSFVETMREIGRTTLQESLGKIPGSRNKKNDQNFSR